MLPKKISVPLVPDAQLDPEKHYSAMEKTAVARLSVKILEAEDVEKKQMMDKLNPYITVASSNGKLESQKRQTKAVDATGDNNCEWNEFFDFLVTDELHEEITFQLMDVGKVSDDKCGKFVLHINELAQLADSGAGWQERWYPLTDCASGRIKLAVEYARFVDDNGPTQIDRAKKKAEPKNTAPPKWVFGQIVLQIKEAKGMPKTVFGGKPRCWCSIEYKSHAGVIKCRTPEVFDDCNPEWNEDLVMREKIDVDISKQEDKYITVVINDSSESRTGALGSVTLKLKEIVAKPGVHTLPVKDKNGKEIAKDATITISATFETIENSPEAAVGSDWLNGIIRKVWHVLTDKIEDKVKDVAGPILHKVRYPDPNPETGEEQSCATFLKIYKDILFETFELGQEPPSFFEMKMLNSRSEQDIQLIISLRWVASDNFSFKVRCQGNTGVPDFSVEIKGLELWLPLFVQVRLAGGGTGLGADVFEVAAMEDPVIKLQLKTEAGLLPGGINVDTIMGLVRSKIRNALVLPNRIRVCLAQDPVQKKVMAADKIGKKGAQDWPRDTRTHNGLAGCICDVGVKEGQVNNGKTVATTVNPDCPVKPGEYVCAVDSKGVPLYESVYDFKVARLRLDDRQKRAVGRLEIKLIEADDLHDPDAWGTVDAFCEVQIVGTGQKKISSTVSNDTAPVWSEMMDFLIVDEMNEVLKFEIFDRDMFKNDFLGEVEIPLSSLVSKSGWRDAWMPLQKNSGGGELHVGLCYRKLDPNDGPVASGTFVDDAGADVTSRALEEEEEESPFKGKLMVTVSKAENLQKMNTFSMTECDPYVMVDFGKNNKKTKTQKGLNPLFNQTFGFDCKTGGSMVVVALYDEETTSKDKMIGKKIFKLEDLVERPGKKWSEAFMLIGEDRQECRDGSGRTSLLYLTIQYVEEGQGLPAEPPAMTGGAGDVVSRDVLDEVSAGPPQASLFVKVIKANDLQKMDWTGAADPYVTITLSGEGKDKTRVMDKNLDPVFEEDFHWQMDKDSTKVLQLTIKDDNKVGTNTFMGIVEIPAQDVRTAKSISNKAYPVVDKKQQPVKGKSGKMATLTLNLDWKE